MVSNLGLGRSEQLASCWRLSGETLSVSGLRSSSSAISDSTIQTRNTWIPTIRFLCCPVLFFAGGGYESLAAFSTPLSLGLSTFDCCIHDAIQRGIIEGVQKAF